MIDIHSHIIPNVDDGAKSIDESIKMLEDEIKMGISDVICTPHYRRHMFTTGANEIYLSFLNLKEEIKKRNLDINIYLGQEIYIHSLQGFKKTLEMLDNKEIFTYENTKYILIEFSYTEEIDIAEAAYIAILKGYKPIIAHVERYQYINTLEKVQEIIDVGALIQVNASSIIGKDGARAKKFIKKLIKNNMISFVSSDIHFKRINYMDLAYNYVVKKNTKEVADKIFEANAFEVLIKGIRERRN